nr:hypothetical protein [Marinobacter sp. AC-23]
MAEQRTATEFHQDKDAAKLIQEIQTVLQILPTLPVFLKALKVDSACLMVCSISLLTRSNDCDFVARDD